MPPSSATFILASDCRRGRAAVPSEFRRFIPFWTKKAAGLTAESENVAMLPLLNGNFYYQAAQEKGGSRMMWGQRLLYAWGAIQDMNVIAERGYLPLDKDSHRFPPLHREGLRLSPKQLGWLAVILSKLDAPETRQMQIWLDNDHTLEKVLWSLARLDDVPLTSMGRSMNTHFIEPDAQDGNEVFFTEPEEGKIQDEFEEAFLTAFDELGNSEMLLLQDHDFAKDEATGEYVVEESRVLMYIQNAVHEGFMSPSCFCLLGYHPVECFATNCLHHRKEFQQVRLGRRWKFSTPPHAGQRRPKGGGKGKGKSRDGGSSLASMRSQIRCYKCQGLGHYARDCIRPGSGPRQFKPRSGTSASSSSSAFAKMKSEVGSVETTKGDQS